MTKLPGFEYPDPTPVAKPTRLRMPVNQVQRMRDLVRYELSQQARLSGHESFDEADDFELDDDDWVSPYEETFEPPPFAKGGIPPPQLETASAEPARPRRRPPRNL